LHLFASEGIRGEAARLEEADTPEEFIDAHQSKERESRTKST
jgi:hypothetical protein